MTEKALTLAVATLFALLVSRGLQSLTTTVLTQVRPHPMALRHP